MQIVAMTTSFATCTHPAVRMFVKHFWQTEGSPGYQVENILPKGEIEMIFSFGERVGYQRGIATEGYTPRCFITGISNTPVRLVIPRHQSFFGVVLHPAAVKKLLSAPSGIFLNTITDLELVKKYFTTLWHQLASCKRFEERIDLMQQWMLGRVSAVHQQEFALSSFLDSHNQETTVAGLAASVYYSTRHLHRKVHELFGMSSEVLLRYRRYKQALNSVHHSNDTLTRIGYECGYYDQAHFTREFKDYTGLTPGTYRQQRSQLPGHLYA